MDWQAPSLLMSVEPSDSRALIITWRRPLRWLAILAAIAGAICFVAALNIARMAYSSQEAVSVPRPASAPANQSSAPSTLNR